MNLMINFTLYEVKEVFWVGCASVLNLWIGKWVVFNSFNSYPADLEGMIIQNIVNHLFNVLFFLTILINGIKLIRVVNKQTANKKDHP